MRKLVLVNIVACLLFSFSLSAQNKQDKNQVDFSLAKQYMGEEKFEEAIGLLEDLLDKKFDNSYYQLLNEAYTKTNQTKKQEKLIKHSIKKNKDNPLYVIDLGMFYYNNNEQDKAKDQFDKVIENLRANNSEITKVANYFSSLRQYEYASQAYKQGRKLFNDDTKYTYEITYIYQMLGKNDEIAREYLVWLRKDPKALNQIEVNINNLFYRDKDDKLYETFSNVVLEEVKKDTKNQQFNLLYYWLLMKKNDYSSAFIQAKAIDKRFNNSDGFQVNEYCQMAMNNNRFEYALQGFEFLSKQGEEMMEKYQVKQNILNCLYNQFIQKSTHTQKEISNLEKEYKQFFTSEGYTYKTAKTMQQYADVLAYWINQPQEAVDLLDTIIAMRQIPNQLRAECKLTRADIFLINGDIWEASLIYSQVEKDFKNETIGSEAKFRNALLSYFTGDFPWALSQADALRSSTTKLIANDAMELSLLINENMDEDSTYRGLTWFAKADFALYQNKLQEAETYLDSIDNWYVLHPLFDEVLYKRAQIAIKEDNYQKADSLLGALIMKYPIDLMADDALMLLAQINEEKFNNKAKAKEYYEKIILDYSSSLYINQARKKYKELSTSN
jgi:predicted Zn-dependent protease